MTEVLSFLEKTLQKQLADENHRVISNLVYTEEDIAIIESVFRNVILSYSVNTSTASNKPIGILSNICQKNIRYHLHFTSYGTA